MRGSCMSRPPGNAVCNFGRNGHCRHLLTTIYGKLGQCFPSLQCEVIILNVASLFLLDKQLNSTETFLLNPSMYQPRFSTLVYKEQLHIIRCSVSDYFANTSAATVVINLKTRLLFVAV